MFTAAEKKPLDVKREFGENHDFYVMKDLGLVKNSPGWRKTWRRIEEFYRGLDGDDMEQFLLVKDTYLVV